MLFTIMFIFKNREFVQKKEVRPDLLAGILRKAGSFSHMLCVPKTSYQTTALYSKEPA
ncbi:hypothetical protein CXIVA_04950 [Clostridium sp. SY8519]|nr:hypothetical protein CXIVA_04950 [Clostridium sp. SY8519]